jgi:predicted AlkP superfamily pyrophosphatase or phosphodiesterase
MMKKIIAALFISFFTLGVSQIDTAQVVVPNRKKSIASSSKPYVILISADGFRHDYAKKYKAENFLKVAKEILK